jgi:hypothetical protein
MTEAAVSFAGYLTDDPRSATPRPASRGRRSGWPCRVGNDDPDQDHAQLRPVPSLTARARQACDAGAAALQGGTP